jgi:hypothetical protein
MTLLLKKLDKNVRFFNDYPNKDHLKPEKVVRYSDAVQKSDHLTTAHKLSMQKGFFLY